MSPISTTMHHHSRTCPLGRRPRLRHSHPRSGETSSWRLARLAADLGNGINQQTPRHPLAVTSLRSQLGLGDRELISLVGGGGKSTMLFDLGNELAAAGRRVILTTTTKMGRDQAMVAPSVCWDEDVQCAVDALASPGPVMLVTGGDDHKVTGPSPAVVDQLFAETNADYIIVEADGSRGRPLKAPAVHEPVVPSLSTTVVILMGIDAVGGPLGEVTHRVEEAVRFTGLDPSHVMTPADCAEIVAHPDGALRSCPPGSRVIVALTKVCSDEDEAAAAEVRRLLAAHPRIAAVVTPGSIRAG